LIEINHLTKQYGKHTAVDDLSLVLKPGKIYGFLGPNGAGKSTTMNMITGYTPASGGEVKINGFDIQKQPKQAKKCIGYLPELPPLYSEMTVYEYLEFVAELKQIKKEFRNINVIEAMELVNIMDVKNRLIRNLSKGYKQRVGFAQAVLGYPDILILDEPTVGLDPKQILEMRELIKTLGKSLTVILSSHILSEVSEVCEHIFILSNGKLVASESTENLTQFVQDEVELYLEIKGGELEVQAVLEEMADSFTYEMEENTEGFGLSEEICKVHIKMHSKDENDIREWLFYQLADQKLPIYEMQTFNKSLEDVFLELTEDVNEEVHECLPF